MVAARLWWLLIALNAALALGIQAAAPSQPAQSDREKYEFAGAHPFAPTCPPLWVVYCYRVLVPGTLELIPVDSEVRWRGYRWAATTAAGSIIAVTVASITSAPAAGVAAAVLTQASYGFAFTAYDPFSADPAVFVFVAAMAWCWMRGRWALALALGLVGMFAKETVALMSASLAVAALIPPRRRGWEKWVGQGALVVAALLAYRWALQSYSDWGKELGQSAGLLQIDLSKGGWLALWLEGNPPVTRVYLLFVSFGFAWLYALLGYRAAPLEWRQLALGSALPFLALNYVQNPERALGNLFFVVIPFAAIALARVPASLAISAAVLTGLITARAATSSVWLPPTKYTLVPAAVAAVVVVVQAVRQTGRQADRG